MEVLGLLPMFGAEREDIAGGMTSDAHEHVAEVVEGVDAVASGIGSNAAKRDHFKTGQRVFVSETNSLLSFGGSD